MLPSFDEVMTEEPQAALYNNVSGRFECRPTYLKHENHGKCAFTSLLPRGEVVMFPSAHAEGNLQVPGRAGAGVRAEAGGQRPGGVPLRQPVRRRAGTVLVPNGAVSNLAGICNPDGNVLGLMPHPERVMFRYQHPDWTRDSGRPDGPGGRAGHLPLGPRPRREEVLRSLHGDPNSTTSPSLRPRVRRRLYLHRTSMMSE